MKFIDIHNHVLYGIDDGAKNAEESRLLLKQAEDEGIEKIIVTPHFHENTVENTKEIVNGCIEELKKQGVKIELLPGNEILLTKNTGDLLNKGIIATLNNTQYILTETYREEMYLSYDLREELYNLCVDNYRPVLAHPERYEFIEKHPEQVYDLVSDGSYMQINARSLEHKSPLFKTASVLIEHNLVAFIATDAHNPSSRPAHLAEAYRFVTDKYGEKTANDLFYNNQMKLIHNEKIISDPVKFKNRKWFLF